VFRFPAVRLPFDTTTLVCLISFFGQLYFFVPVMTPYLLGHDLTMAEIAGMQTVLLWAMLVMEVPTGVLADRLGHRLSYTVALVMATAGEAIVLVGNDYPTFLLAQLVAGTGFAFSSGSVSAIVYASLPEDGRAARMQRAWGRVGAAGHAGSLFAYTVGGYLTRDLSMASMRLVLVMGMIGVAIAALLSLFLLVDGQRETVVHRPSSLALLASGWRTLRSSPPLQRLVLFSLLTNGFGAHLLVFYQQYFLESDVDGAWFGLALGLGSAAAIVTQVFAWRLVPWLGSIRALQVAALVPAVLYVAMALLDAPMLAVALLVLQWGAVHASAPLFAGLFNRAIPDEARATTLSLISGITTLYVGTMGIALGWLSERSIPWTFAAIAASIALGLLLVRQPDSPGPQGEDADAVVRAG
jgi:MFS family permease